MLSSATAWDISGFALPLVVLANAAIDRKDRQWPEYGLD
jgi:hypothetical protein